MDYNNDNNGSSDMWDYCLQKDANLEISQCIWDGVTQNEEDLSYMFDGTTPIKDCGDLAYHVSNNENMSKELEPCRESSSQLKRRRMLQFDTEVLDAPFCDEEMSPNFLKSKESMDSVEEALSDVSQWVSGFAEDPSASGYEGLNQSSEGWLVDCLNDSEMHFGPDDMNLSGASDVQIDMTEFCNTPPEPEYEANVQERPTRTRRKNVVFKGRKSYMQTPTKLASSVAYPFAFIKPCGVHGDVTLKDINQRIRTPPPSTSKQTSEDPSSYPTSAITGKPVVGKTKIRTEGGKGSITIMRTKG